MSKIERLLLQILSSKGYKPADRKIILQALTFHAGDKSKREPFLVQAISILRLLSSREDIEDAVIQLCKKNRGQQP